MQSEASGAKFRAQAISLHCFFWLGGRCFIHFPELALGFYVFVQPVHLARTVSPSGVAKINGYTMHLYAPASAAKFIPVIDMAGSHSTNIADRKAIAAAMHKACRDIGFFYVSNHGVPDSLISGQFAAAKDFFDLPLTEREKLNILNSPTQAGYVAIKGLALDSQDASGQQAPPDLNEGLYLGLELPPGHKYENSNLRAFGHNQWPATLPHFRAQTMAYYSDVRSLANRIMSLLALSLDMPEDWFAPHFDTSMSAVRMIKYPPQPPLADANQLGAGAHTDWSAMTVLAQDDIGGLEVRNIDGDWIKAPPIKGTFVVNLGDLMARWSNGLYSSNLHRVLNNQSGKDRYSIPFFHGPDPFTVIDPIPTCIDDQHPRQFETCTAVEHINEMYRRSHGIAHKQAAA